MLKQTSFALLVLSLFVASAQAQDELGASDTPEVLEASEPSEVSEDPATPEVSDAAPAGGEQGRFRFGINGTVGLESVSGLGDVSISGLMYGLDLRLGYQVNDLLAIYAQPHLSVGSLSVDGGGDSLTGFTGTIVTSVMAEATFVDTFFVGGGLGYAIFNNPSGLALDLKAGAYPLSSRDPDGIGRTGLMVALDMRVVFLDDPYSGLLIMGCIGYESF